MTAFESMRVTQFMKVLDAALLNEEELRELEAEIHARLVSAIINNEIGVVYGKKNVRRNAGNKRKNISVSR